MEKPHNIKIPSSWMSRLPDDPSGVFQKAWIINAEWAHPLWSQYVLFLYDLSTKISGSREEIFKKDPCVTHEILMYAVDPTTKIIHNVSLLEQKWQRLEPANYGYQFTAESNEAAFDRIAKLVDRIASKALSPDTDYRRVWDDIFKDGFSLHSSAFDNVNINGVTH